LRFEPLEWRRLLTSVVPSWSSFPGAPVNLYLDFDGAAAFNWVGQNSNGTQIVTYQVHGAGPTNTPVPAFTIDENAADFNNQELDAMYRIWQWTAEKYSPFQVNVTTVDPGPLNDFQNARVLIGGSDSDWLNEGAGGRASIGSFMASNLDNTCFVFSADAVASITSTDRLVQYLGETTAHEAGHMFGLLHQRRGDGMGGTNDEYFDGDSTRAPIMGGSSNNTGARGIWWKTNNWAGQNSPDPVADELASLGSLLQYRADDRGNTAATAEPMNGTSGQVYDGGVIENIADQDWFSYTQIGTTATFTVNNALNGGMLAPAVELRDAAGNLIATGTTTNTQAVVSASGLTSGASYRVVVKSQGNYGDIGQYAVSGTLDTFATLNSNTRTIVVTGYVGQSDNISVYADEVNGRIIVSDNGVTQAWGVNFVDNVLIALNNDNSSNTISLYPINPLGNPRISVTGSAAGHDTLYVYGTGPTDPFSISDDVIEVTDFSVVVSSGGANYVELSQYVQVEEINIYGGIGNDQFNVRSLAQGVNLILYGEDGNDLANVGTGDLDAIRAHVTFSGGNGVDSMVIDDSSHATPRTYLFSLVAIVIDGNQYNYGSPTTENVTIHGTSGGGTFQADILLAGVNYTINGGLGNDSIALGGSFQNVLTTAQGGLTINASGGSDTLTFNDQAGSSIFSIGGGATNFRVGLQGNTVYYNNSLENVVVNCGAGNNSISIDGPNMLTAVTVNAGEGDDTIAIAGSGGSGGSLNLSYIGADVTVNGQGGNDTLFIHNQNGPALNETLSSTSVAANHTYNYTGIEVLSIDLSQFGETIYVIATKPNTNTTIYANGGNDTCYFLTTDLANSYNIAFYGQAGIDTAVLNDQDATGSHTYQLAAGSVSRGTFAFSYDGSNLESLQLNASNSADTFSVSGLGTSTTINAGLGDDMFTLNNLTGTLTIIGGGGLDQVTQNDLPVVDGFNRILISDTQVRHLYRTSLPLNGPYSTQSTVNYSQIHNYVIASEYLTRFEVFSTPASTNFAINGSAEGAIVRLGSSTLVSTGNGNVDNIRGLFQFFGWSGAVNSLTIDDGADTTGDTVRVIPNLISNGPGAPLFASGGSVNYYNVTSATLVLGSGSDTVYARPSSQNTVAIHGQNPTTSPGDTLNLALAEAQNYVIHSTGVGAGNVTSSNLQTLSWTGIEEGPFVDDVAPSIIGQSYDESVIPTILVQFSEDVSGGLDVSYLKLLNTATGQPISSTVMAVTYESGTNTARFAFPGYPAGRLPAGNYSSKILPGLPDLFGNPLPGPTPTLLFSVVPVLPGDYNQDSAVGAADYVLWRKTLGASVPNYSGADGSGNGLVGAEDYGVWTTNFGRTTASGQADGSGQEAAFAAQATSGEPEVSVADVQTAYFAWRHDVARAWRVELRGPEQAAEWRWRDDALVAWLASRGTAVEKREEIGVVVKSDEAAAEASAWVDLQDVALAELLAAEL
jgi:hypothetical protein